MKIYLKAAVVLVGALLLFVGGMYGQVSVSVLTDGSAHPDDLVAYTNTGNQNLYVAMWTTTGAPVVGSETSGPFVGLVEVAAGCEVDYEYDGSVNHNAPEAWGETAYFDNAGVPVAEAPEYPLLVGGLPNDPFGSGGAFPVNGVVWSNAYTDGLTAWFGGIDNYPVYSNTLPTLTPYQPLGGFADQYYSLLQEGGEAACVVALAIAGIFLGQWIFRKIVARFKSV